MDKEKEVVLVNNSEGRMTINFLGSFPQNKFTRTKGGKIYLTEKEFEWLQMNKPELLESGLLTLEGQEVAAAKTEKKDLSEFFSQNTNSAKAKINKMNDAEKINELIDFANDNEIEGKIVDALIDRFNELGE